jgi:hypothetical protein
VVDEPAAVVAEYFRRVGARDDQIAALFAPDASLIGLGTVVSGSLAIADFYRESIERAAPTPTLVGSLLVDGSRVAAEIVIALTGLPPLHVVDLFVVNDGLIDSLTYFLSDHP